jgi:rhamnosyltransferase
MNLACVTVTYHPDIEVLRRQLMGLPQAALKVVVDNASADVERTQLRVLAEQIPDCLLIELDRNLGLAEGINVGARLAATRQNGGQILFLDQDSEPEPGSIERLVVAHERLLHDGVKVGCVGPRLVDVDTGLDHGFHVPARVTWRRQYLSSGSPIRVANINGSGTLVSAHLFERLGGLRSDFFIDHVDTEWAFRVQAAGYEVYGVPSATFLHRMGVRGRAFWFFGWRVWPHRSPARHYFLFRNSILLMRSPLPPLRWKAWAPLKLLVTVIVHGIFDPERREQLKQMLRGVSAGLRNSPPPRL